MKTSNYSSLSSKRFFKQSSSELRVVIEKNIPEVYKSKLNDSEISLESAIIFARAVENLAECEGCVGAPCRKTSRRYEIPLVDEWNGEKEIAFVTCKVKAESLKSETGAVPLKYSDKTFADCVVVPDNERAIKLAKWFVTKKPAKSLYLYGGTGSGKTTLATLIAKEYRDAIFGDVPTLLGKIKATFNGNGDSQEIISRYCTCELLILDDLGAGQITEWNADILYQIINNRYNLVKPTIITSNFDLDGLQKRLAVKDKDGKVIDTYSADRITSRLSEVYIQAFLGIKDWRKPE